MAEKLRTPFEMKGLADLDTCETCGAPPGKPCDREFFPAVYPDKVTARQDKNNVRMATGMQTIRFYNGVDLGAVYHRGRLRGHMVDKRKE